MYLFIQNLLLNRKFFQFKNNFPALHPEERNQSQHLRKAEKVLLSFGSESRTVYVVGTFDSVVHPMK